MKRLLIALISAPCIALAKPVSFDFQGVSLVAFSQATFKNIMGRDFVIAADVLVGDRKITMSVKNIDTADVPAFVESILQQQNIAVTLRNGVYYLTSVRPQDVVTEKAGKASEAVQMADASKPSSLGAQGDLNPPKQLENGHLGRSVRRSSDDESRIYNTNGRNTEFLATVVNSVFGLDVAVAADSRLVLTGSKSELDKVVGLVESLDVVPYKVNVSASWVEVARTDGAGRGISLLANVLGMKLGASIGTVNSATAISLKNTNFELVLDALNTDTRFNQISNSRMVGDEYKKINLTVGDETPTISSTGKDNSGNLVQNIVYRPSGVIIDVLPKVLGSGRINMDIDGQISSFKATQTGVSGSPTLSKRQVKTSVTVSDGEVLLIGGLNENKSTDSTSGLSFLPKSWTLANQSSSNTDLVLILSATVVK